jgi:hypothetical protein
LDSALFGSKREELTGKCRKFLRKFIACTVYHITNVIDSRRMRWAQHVACRYIYKIIVRMLAVKRLLGKWKCREDYNIKIALTEI